jgi:hypothetical protein
MLRRSKNGLTFGPNAPIHRPSAATAQGAHGHKPGAVIAGAIENFRSLQCAWKAANQP